MERILKATAELLEEEGHENLTTVRVAERSGVNIASLYSYFPNKLALLHASAQNLAEQLQGRYEAVYSRFHELGWRDTLDAAIDALVDFKITTKGAEGASRAMRSHPALREIDRQQDLRNAQAIALLLAEAGIAGSRDKLQVIALVLAQTVTGVMDNALMWEPENAAAIMDNVKLMLRQYIEHLLRQAEEGAFSGDISD